MTEPQKAIQEVDKFSDWMRDTVRTIHYADNRGMSEAYERIMSNYLEIKIYSNKDAILTE